MDYPEDTEKGSNNLHEEMGYVLLTQEVITNEEITGQKEPKEKIFDDIQLLTKHHELMDDSLRVRH